MPSSETLRRWLPVVSWAAVISTLSTSWFTSERTGDVLLPLLAALFPSATPAQLVIVHQTIRKMAHFLEYLVLSVLLFRALRRGRRWDARAAGIAIVIAAVYAIADEFHQVFVPGRAAAATDCLINFSGAACGQGWIAARDREARRATR